MSTLLIKNIRTLVSCDSADTVYENVDLYAENGFIKAIGASLDRKADKTIDASHMRRADEALLHGARRVDGREYRHSSPVQPRIQK